MGQHTLNYSKIQIQRTKTHLSGDIFDHEHVRNKHKQSCTDIYNK